MMEVKSETVSEYGTLVQDAMRIWQEKKDAEDALDILCQATEVEPSNAEA